VVLAAQNKNNPFRRSILEGSAVADAKTGSALFSPQPRELQLEGIRPDQVNGLLDVAYGKDSGASFDGVVSGLRALREDGRLCDARVKAGDKTFPIHQVVLAAASASLRDFITSAVADLTGGATTPNQPQLAPEDVEIELQAFKCGEALGIVLDHVYGSLETYRPTSQAVNTEVFQMCTAFDLPVLRGLADKWRPDEAQGGVQRAGSRPGAAKAASTQADRRGEPAQEQEQEPEPAAASAPVPVHKQEEAPVPAANPRQALPELKAADFERTMKALQTLRFDNWRDVPPMPPRNIAEAGLKRHEVKLLEHLRKAFEQRPVWLQGPLLERILNVAPTIFDYDTLQRLFPRVAYQWNDGPWATAFTRLGWDPRQKAEASKFQVLEFRDPALKGISRKEVDKSVDYQFRRPPVLQRQYYQFMDIKDETVSSFIGESEVEEECTKKFGWLKDWVLEACQQRLINLSDEMRARERIADTPRPSKSHTVAATAGRPQKRARIS
jgi:hypothetical protein